MCCVSLSSLHADQLLYELISMLSSWLCCLQVCCGLEVLRGAAAATLPSTYPALLNIFNSLLNPLLALHAAFKYVAPVVALLLKLADDIVENLPVYMEEVQPKEHLLNWTLQLLVQYRDSNLWQVGGRNMHCVTSCTFMCLSGGELGVSCVSLCLLPC